jgi:hypothetical protein
MYIILFIIFIISIISDIQLYLKSKKLDEKRKDLIMEIDEIYKELSSFVDDEK